MIVYYLIRLPLVNTVGKRYECVCVLLISVLYHLKLVIKLFMHKPKHDNNGYAIVFCDFYDFRVCLVCTVSNCIYQYHIYYLYVSVQIPLMPESVTGRYNHSLTAVTMSPHCVWLVIIGGCEEIKREDDGGGLKKPVSNVWITDTNRLIMIIELGKSYCNKYNKNF